MKKNRIFIILPVVCCIVSGCSGKPDIKVSKSVPEETESIEENSENEESVQELSNEEKEDTISAYTWHIEPSVMADDIIVADIEFSSDISFSNYYASYESAIVESDGKYGIISYDGTYIAEPQYTRYSPLNPMMACSLLEVSDENLGSVEVFNGEYDIEVKHNEPYGFGYMAYSYYAIDGMDVVSLWDGSVFNDGVVQGTFLKDNPQDNRQFAVVQKRIY